MISSSVGIQILQLSVSILLYVNNLCADDPKSVLIFNNANSRDTYFTMHKIKEAQSLSKGSNIKVGILDHSFAIDLHKNMYTGGQNFATKGDIFLKKRQWHGFWMANTLREIAPEVQIYALNVKDFEPNQNTLALVKPVIDAIDWAISNKLDIITYSHPAFSGEAKSLLFSALDRAYNAGLITVFIHTGHEKNILPWGLWPGKSGGREPDLNILHYDYNIVFIHNYYESIESNKSNRDDIFTSVSSTAPVVAGVIALMKSLKPELTRSECKKILIETSYCINFGGNKIQRVLDAFAATNAVVIPKVIETTLK